MYENKWGAWCCPAPACCCCCCCCSFGLYLSLARIYRSLVCPAAPAFLTRRRRLSRLPRLLCSLFTIERLSTFLFCRCLPHWTFVLSRAFRTSEQASGTHSERELQSTFVFFVLFDALSYELMIMSLLRSGWSAMRVCARARGTREGGITRNKQCALNAVHARKNSTNGGVPAGRKARSGQGQK